MGLNEIEDALKK